ncbi:hypothetical protein [Pseudomonas syringae]|uniref:hypothetical protein n=1 Tax=Pseudomonas syringae TaxID=317 RepID=UPI0006CB7E23|nr:hypothetical protein [Pseudomonas syringae]ALE00543.1 hypothetical protein PSYRMG_13410 [Pseudomonas syringae UMAF0158]MCK9731028.1 hypothetical protein [Pseudomonas syringae pv. syringae]PBP61391.1 hypothetical protein CCL18_04420 [Pseudomonas syringae]
MAKHLTKADISAILDTINGWKKPPITWDAICDAVQPIVGKRPTRQSLSSYPLVKIAYKKKAEALSFEYIPRPSPSSFSVSQARLEKLEVELSVMAARNQALLEKFVVWQYNASKHGISEMMLNERLPRIDRERSVPKSVKNSIGKRNV